MKRIRMYVEQYCIINMVNLETGTFCYFSLTYTVKITLTNMSGTGTQAYKNQHNILMPSYIKKLGFLCWSLTRMLIYKIAAKGR